MKRPELRPEYAEDIYPYYENRIRLQGRRLKITRGILQLALNGSALYVKPKTLFSDEARAKVSVASSGEQGVILASTHKSYADFVTMAATIARQRELYDLTGKHFALAKKNLFSAKWRNGLENPLTRTVVEAVGGIPVFRKKDMEAGDASRRPAIERLVETSARLMADGYNAMIFPHGIINKEGVGRIESGIGRIAVATAELTGQPVDIVPIGIHYRGKGYRDVFVSIGEPFMAPDSIEKVVLETEMQLQERENEAETLAYS